MTYNVFDDSSCTLTPSERRAEASRIVNRISDCVDQMSPAERIFVEQMNCDFAPVSVKQLFYLRDLNDRY